jgi:hypothetical protein
MDTDAFFDRMKRRVAELEAAGKRVPADIKKTLRQRPQHGYRLDIIERLAKALEWGIPELLAELWRSAKFSEEAVPYGLTRHAVCLQFARRRHVVNQLALPGEEERRLEDRVAELYKDWQDLEAASGKRIDAATILAVFERIYPRQKEVERHYLDRPADENPPSQSPTDSQPPKSEETNLPKMAMPDDRSETPLAA